MRGRIAKIRKIDNTTLMDYISCISTASPGRIFHECTEITDSYVCDQRYKFRDDPYINSFNYVECRILVRRIRVTSSPGSIEFQFVNCRINHLPIN